MMMKEPRGFGWALRRAEQLAKDPKKVAALLAKGLKKASKNPRALQSVWDGLTTLLRLVGAWRKGDYKEIPRRTIVSVIAAIMYLVIPLDAIPDFIPVAGLVDDVTVISFVLASMKEDIQKFRAWEKENKGQHTAQSTTPP